MVVTGKEADAFFGPWISRKVGGTWTANAVTIGVLSKDGRPKGGVIFEGYNGVNIFAHIAGEGPYWLEKEFLWYIFYYPFEELECRRITVTVPESNKASQALAEKLGFELETRLTEAHPDGDLLVYRLFKDKCRWHTRKANHGQRRSTSVP